MAGTDGEDEHNSAEDDQRTPCKYGSKCYQKNPAHLQKYKHPQKRESNDDGKKQSHKKHKPEQTRSSEVYKDGKMEVENILDKEDNEKGSSEIDDVEPETSLNENKGEGGSNNKENHSVEPASPEDVRESIKQKFLVEMPEDFYSFWSFCHSVRHHAPLEALSDIGLHLVGPFDVLAGRFKNTKPKKESEYLRHWRYYYDPPEFQTVLRGDDKTQFHMGYFRDDPKELPVFVASNAAAENCKIHPMGGNIFSAVRAYLKNYSSKCSPFQSMKVASLKRHLIAWAEKEKIDLETPSPEMKTRSRKVVAKTFHSAGIVVPVNKQNDTGYRPLLETDAQLKRILQNCADSTDETERRKLMDKLQEVITAANIANDECDFGTSLELGIDLFSFGGEIFHRMSQQLLCTAYTLLQRNEFAQILKAHLEDRRKGTDLSIISSSE
ncbi:histone PARylation factor 1 [Anabrus simplex]|uniref:histone PARylation factor 1 n=1 Tax=Anabrus simplex TaxID=316456 RepID=UPI0035A3A5CE